MRQNEIIGSVSELELVVLQQARMCNGKVLPEGATGTVVSVYRDGAACEVEFTEPFHCILTLSRDEIQRI